MLSILIINYTGKPLNLLSTEAVFSTPTDIISPSYLAGDCCCSVTSFVQQKGLRKLLTAHRKIWVDILTAAV